MSRLWKRPLPCAQILKRIGPLATILGCWFLLILASPSAGFGQTEEDVRMAEQQLLQLNAEIQRLESQISSGHTSGPTLDASSASTQPPEYHTFAYSAEPPAAPPAELGELDEIMKRLDTLEAAQAKAKEKEPEKKKDDGWLDLSGEKWNIKLGGHVQMDYVLWPDHAPSIVGAENYFEFRRLRLLADGQGYGVFDFRIQIDIEPEAESEDGVNGPVTTIKDAYLTMNDVAYVNRLRWGNFFVPYSLEQVTNDTNNIFVERSIPTQGVFAADREVGMAAYNINAAQNFTWTFGVFFDSISEALKERVDDNQGTRISGRLTYLPYYDEASNGRYLVHLGTGVLHTEEQDDIARFRTRPQIHEGPRLIDSGAMPAASTTSGNLEFATVMGPFSVQSELFLTSVNLDDGGPTPLYGAYLYASYFLTGENRIYERFGQHGAQFARNVPFSNFFLVPGGYGPGAWELKSRMSYLDMTEVDTGVYHDITNGFNWYWTDRIRMMFDWIHPITNAQTVFGATQSDILAMRLDFNF